MTGGDDRSDRGAYRALLDALVAECRSGQGTVLPGRVRAGVWGPAAAAHPGQDPEDDAANAVLAGLDPARCEVVAGR